MSEFGLVRAIVTDNKDPDQLGRVRVRFHWLAGNSANKQSAWARVARNISHNQSGDWFLPDVNDEVLVGFEFNQAENPIVIASVFSESNKPPKAESDGDFNSNGENNLRFIRTKSGHLLCFDDLKGKESIRLEDKANNQFKIDTSKNEISLQDANGNQIKTSPEGTHIKDKSGNEISMKSSGISIQAASTVSIDGASTVELGKGASEALVKGQSFMSIFNAHTHPCPGGSSSPPSTPMTPAQLSTKVKTI